MRHRDRVARGRPAADLGAAPGAAGEQQERGQNDPAIPESDHHICCGSREAMAVSCRSGVKKKARTEKLFRACAWFSCLKKSGILPGIQKFRALEGLAIRDGKGIGKRPGSLRGS